MMLTEDTEHSRPSTPLPKGVSQQPTWNPVTADLGKEDIRLSQSLLTILNNLEHSRDCETVDAEYEGLNVRDLDGKYIEVIAWRKPLEHRQNPLQGISFNHLGPDGGVQWVDQFSVRLNAGRKARSRAETELEILYETLQASGTLTTQIRNLGLIAESGIVRHDGFSPQCEEFHPHQALLRDQSQLARSLGIWLQDRGVNIDAWGKGATRGIEKLAKQLMHHEVAVSFEAGGVYIDSRVILMDIRSPEGDQRIFEAYQRRLPTPESPDGSIRVRRNLGAVPAEKANPLETNEQVAIRLLGEELGIHDSDRSYRDALKYLGSKTAIESSLCFPGCHTRNHYVGFKVTLKDSDYKLEYRETGDFITVSRWTNVES